MSKIGKKPIPVPKGVEIKWNAPRISVKGPKGELNLEIRPEISLEINEKELRVKKVQENKLANALHGTYRSLILNMIQGVTQGYEKRLELVGVGYKAEVKGKSLILQVGFSHPVYYPVPEGVEITMDKAGKIIIRGIDKRLVGQVAAEIRAIRPPEPYQGKGIRYEGEHIRRKAGKAAVGTGPK